MQYVNKKYALVRIFLFYEKITKAKTLNHYNLESSLILPKN